MSMGRFSISEQEAVAAARKENPSVGQRTLAEKLYRETSHDQIGHLTRFRSRAAIYSALRRHDAARKSFIKNGIDAANQSELEDEQSLDEIAEQSLASV